MVLFGSFQGCYLSGIGPPFCQALTSQKQHYLWCQICSLPHVLISTLMTVMSPYAATWLKPSASCLWRWPWQPLCRLALDQARPPAIQWLPHWWPTRDLPATRPSVLYPLHAATPATKSSRLTPPSGNMISSVPAASQCAMNCCYGSGQCRVSSTG